jgi:hypothetical protein
MSSCTADPLAVRPSKTTHRHGAGSVPSNSGSSGEPTPGPIGCPFGDWSGSPFSGWSGSPTADPTAVCTADGPAVRQRTDLRIRLQTDLQFHPRKPRKICGSPEPRARRSRPSSIRLSRRRRTRRRGGDREICARTRAGSRSPEACAMECARDGRLVGDPAPAPAPEPARWRCCATLRLGWSRPRAKSRPARASAYARRVIDPSAYGRGRERGSTTAPAGRSLPALVGGRRCSLRSTRWPTNWRGSGASSSGGCDKDQPGTYGRKSPRAVQPAEGVTSEGDSPMTTKMAVSTPGGR